MNNFDDKGLGQLVRDAVAPVSEHELQRDLWPQMRLKLNDQGVRFRWLDLVLAVIAVIVCVTVPEAIAGLLFNL